MNQSEFRKRLREYGERLELLFQSVGVISLGGEIVDRLGYQPATLRTVMRTFESHNPDWTTTTAGIQHFSQQLPDEGESDLDDYDVLDQWIDNPTVDPVCILGEAGSGKSCLIESLALKLTENRDDWHLRGKSGSRPAYVPIIVKLQQVTSGIGDSILAAETQLLEGYLGPALTKDMLSQLNDRRQLAFLFDGFDELAPSKRGFIADQLRQYSRKAPVLITSRPGYAAEAVFTDASVLRLTDVPAEKSKDYVRRFFENHSRNKRLRHPPEYWAAQFENDARGHLSEYLTRWLYIKTWCEFTSGAGKPPENVGDMMECVYHRFSLRRGTQVDAPEDELRRFATWFSNVAYQIACNNFEPTTLDVGVPGNPAYMDNPQESRLFLKDAESAGLLSRDPTFGKYDLAKIPLVEYLIARKLIDGLAADPAVIKRFLLAFQRWVWSSGHHDILCLAFGLLWSGPDTQTRIGESLIDWLSTISGAWTPLRSMKQGNAKIAPSVSQDDLIQPFALLALRLQSTRRDGLTSDRAMDVARSLISAVDRNADYQILSSYQFLEAIPPRLLRAITQQRLRNAPDGPVGSSFAEMLHVGIYECKNLIREDEASLAFEQILSLLKRKDTSKDAIAHLLLAARLLASNAASKNPETWYMDWSHRLEEAPIGTPYSEAIAVAIRAGVSHFIPERRLFLLHEVIKQYKRHQSDEKVSRKLATAVSALAWRIPRKEAVQALPAVLTLTSQFPHTDNRCLTELYEASMRLVSRLGREEMEFGTSAVETLLDDSRTTPALARELRRSLKELAEKSERDTSRPAAKLRELELRLQEQRAPAIAELHRLFAEYDVPNADQSYSWPLPECAFIENGANGICTALLQVLVQYELDDELGEKFCEGIRNSIRAVDEDVLSATLIILCRQFEGRHWGESARRKIDHVIDASIKSINAANVSKVIAAVAAECLENHENSLAKIKLGKIIITAYRSLPAYDAPSHIADIVRLAEALRKRGLDGIAEDAEQALMIMARHLSADEVLNMASGDLASQPARVLSALAMAQPTLALVQEGWNDQSDQPRLRLARRAELVLTADSEFAPKNLKLAKEVIEKTSSFASESLNVHSENLQISTLHDDIVCARELWKRLYKMHEKHWRREDHRAFKKQTTSRKTHWLGEFLEIMTRARIPVTEGIERPKHAQWKAHSLAFDQAVERIDILYLIHKSVFPDGNPPGTGQTKGQRVYVCRACGAIHEIVPGHSHQRPCVCTACGGDLNDQFHEQEMPPILFECSSCPTQFEIGMYLSNPWSKNEDHRPCPNEDCNGILTEETM